ncbi:hypothetical protein EYF80_052214 [Liparis tanakae]|uniref:Uncharacterized protein n=1 Tax=Liparis tanakae TaxID=230148 RepID=A0A4Z2FB48_9TELE|nr:hypothetical protein EYF80_052214 [Liparis tanakae]
MRSQIQIQIQIQIHLHARKRDESRRSVELRWEVERVPASPYLLGFPNSDSIGLDGLRMGGGLSPILCVEPGAE